MAQNESIYDPLAFCGNHICGKTLVLMLWPKMLLANHSFSEKIVFQGKQAILSLKMMFPHHFGSTVSIFLKFCSMKGAKSYTEIRLVFLKKNLIQGRLAISGLKMACAHNFGSVLRIFFEILHNEMGQEVHEIILTDFLKKFLYGANRPFWARKWWVLITLYLP